MSAPVKLYLDRDLAPHQSLSQAGFRTILACVLVFNLIFAGFCLVIGAWPVPIFLGLDVVLLALGFWASRQAAKRFLRVKVSADDVVVERVDPKRQKEVWRSRTHFTRIEVFEPSEEDLVIRLAFQNQSLRLAEALGPRARADFLTDLRAAILAAKSERH